MEEIPIAALSIIALYMQRDFNSDKKREKKNNIQKSYV